MILDGVLPLFDVAKTHRVAVAAPPERTFAAVRDYDLRDAFLIRALMRLRGYGARMSRVRERAPLAQTLTRFGFVLLGEEPGREPGGLGDREPSTEGKPPTVGSVGFPGAHVLPSDPSQRFEIVFGLVGQFWRFSGGLRAVTASEFHEFAEPGYAKAAWNLLVAAQQSGGSLLSTETRVRCLGEEARRKFLAYWRFIEPGSGAIRRAMLRGIRRNALRRL